MPLAPNFPCNSHLVVLGNFMRTISQHYEDPLDLIWKNAAAQLGINVVRDPEVFAAWNGKGELRIGTPETLDPDDSLAQMVFHELCHALIEGPEQFQCEDWGLDYDKPEHAVHEHAALRLQAALAAPFNLQDFLASTTDFRTYYDQLKDNPLSDENDPAAELARAAWDRANQGRWGEVIGKALQKTQIIRELVSEIADQKSLWASNSQATNRNS